MQVYWSRHDLLADEESASVRPVHDGEWDDGSLNGSNSFLVVSADGIGEYLLSF